MFWLSKFLLIQLLKIVLVSHNSLFIKFWFNWTMPQTISRLILIIYGIFSSTLRVLLKLWPILGRKRHSRIKLTKIISDSIIYKALLTLLNRRPAELIRIGLMMILINWRWRNTLYRPHRTMVNLGRKTVRHYPTTRML